MGFIESGLANGRKFQVLSVVDQHILECLTLYSEAGRRWWHLNRIHPNLPRPGGPVEYGHIESFNGRVRDECLDAEVFLCVAEVRRQLELWRRNYNCYGREAGSQNRTLTYPAAAQETVHRFPKLRSAKLRTSAVDSIVSGTILMGSSKGQLRTHFLIPDGAKHPFELGMAPQLACLHCRAEGGRG